MKSELVQVPFHGDVLDCVQEDGKVWVSIRRGCENLGLDYSRQLQKLKSKAWAVVGEKPTTAPDGKTYQMACCDLDTLPGWLFSVDARKVKESIREKLARYQKEAAKVLADHFYGRTSGVNRDELRSVIAEEMRNFVTKLPPSTHFPAPATPRFTVQERLRFKGWPGTTKKQRAQVRRLANLLLDLRHQETPDVAGGPGGPLTFYGHQLAVLDEAIDRVRGEYQQRHAAAGSTLFDSRV